MLLKAQAHDGKQDKMLCWFSMCKSYRQREAEVFSLDSDLTFYLLDFYSNI